MTLVPLVLSAVLASNASGKTLVRTNPGTIVPIASSCKTLICGYDGAAVSHVYFDGTQIRDTKGNTWTQNGTVPQVARSGATPPGAGPYSTSNYYTGWTFSGTTFSACMVASFPETASTARIIGDGGTSRWVFERVATDLRMTVPTVGSVSSGVTVVGLNVMCIGANGGAIYAKSNLATFATATAAMGGTPAATRIGLAFFTDGTAVVHEFWFSTTAPSDALFTTIQQRVKTRAAITAW